MARKRKAATASATPDTPPPEQRPADSMPSLQEIKRLKTYKSFKLQLSATKFEINSFVYVKGSQSTEPRARRRESSVEAEQPDDWLAQILDIRANDNKAVYLAIAWLFTSSEQFNDYQPILKGYKQFKRHEVVHSDVIEVIDVNMVQDSATVMVLDDSLPLQPYIPLDCLWYRTTFRAVKAEELGTLEKTLNKKLFDRHTRSAARDHVRSCYPLNEPTCECGKGYHPYLVEPEGGAKDGSREATSEMVFCPRDSCRRWRHVACVMEQPATTRNGWSLPAVPAMESSPEASHLIFMSSGVDLLPNLFPSPTQAQSHAQSPTRAPLPLPMSLPRAPPPNRALDPGPEHKLSQLLDALPELLCDAAQLSIRRGTPYTGVSGAGDPIIRARGVLVYWAEFYRKWETIPTWQAQRKLPPLEAGGVNGEKRFSRGAGSRGVAVNYEPDAGLTQSGVQYGPRNWVDAMVDFWMEEFAQYFTSGEEGEEGGGRREEDEKERGQLGQTGAGESRRLVEEEKLVCRHCRHYI